MDATLLPSLGITGALVIVIGYLLLNQRHRETQHAAELAAERVAHAEDLIGLRSRLASLEQRLTELENELDRERERRRAAEDDAAAARRH